MIKKAALLRLDLFILPHERFTVPYIFQNWTFLEAPSVTGWWMASFEAWRRNAWVILQKDWRHYKNSCNRLNVLFQQTTPRLHISKQPDGLWLHFHIALWRTMARTERLGVQWTVASSFSEDAVTFFDLLMGTFWHLMEQHLTGGSSVGVVTMRKSHGNKCRLGLPFISIG